MDVFLSYRRSVGGDTMQAGRVHDYLREKLRLQVYYDRSEFSNPTGPQFPQTIRNALDECKVVIALINADWLARIHELHDEGDWVRRELLEGHPSRRKTFIPVYINAAPGQLTGKLPAALDFLATSNSQLLWRNFEDPEKSALKALLHKHLPIESAVDKVADSPRLELLCDRTRPEDCFHDAIGRQPEAGVGSGWLLFGERDQSAGDMFERIRGFTLKAHVASQMIQLQLQDAEPAADAVLEAILKSAAKALSISQPTKLEDLPDALAKKSIQLTVFHAVVDIADARQAERWSQCFGTLLQRLHATRRSSVPGNSALPARSNIVFALALVYAPMQRTLLLRLRERIANASPTLKRWFMRHPRSFFETTFPRHFESELEPFTYPPGVLLTSRLRPALRQHVDDWFGDPQVRGHVRGDSKLDLLRTFDNQSERPMGTVLVDLAALLQAAPQPKTGAIA